MDLPNSEAAQTEREWTRAQREAICAELRIEMSQTKDVQITFGHGRTLVTWTGQKTLSAADTATFLAKIAGAI
jgi:hypothetical protein